MHTVPHQKRNMKMSNITGICAKCLGDAIFTDTLWTHDNRAYDLYTCPTCGAFNRAFHVPQTSQEVVLKEIITEKQRQPPAREVEVEKQLGLWTNEPRTWY